MQNYYYFAVSGFQHPLSYISKALVDRFPWDTVPPYFTVDHEQRTVTFSPPPDASRAVRTDLFEAILHTVVSTTSPIKCLRRWRDERIPVWYHPTASGVREYVMDIDRCGAEFLSVPNHGVHMTGWTTAPDGQLRLWVPRRAATKSMYPNMLDNTVGGTLRANESPLDGIIREAEEELCIPPAYSRAHIRACGTLATHPFNTINGVDCPDEARTVQYTYELEMDPAVVTPRIGDGEVGEILLMDVDELRRRLAAGEFKPPTVVTYMAFLIRRGVITAENEPDYVEICARLQRPYDIYRH